MRLIFSRKGFDSESGGVPSPIFPTGRIVSLPIPQDSDIRFQDIAWESQNLGPLVEDLTKSRLQRGDGVHHDPDLRREAMPRQRGWLPAFGQAGAAQTHLSNQSVGKGDLFLFFGWFRRVHLQNGKWTCVPGTPDIHLIFGWLQVGEVYPLPGSRPPYWAGIHPHLNSDLKNNCLYIAKQTLELPGLRNRVNGGGAFPNFQSVLQLTCPGRNRGIWLLPQWLNPAGRKSSLSYHGKKACWTQHADGALLEVVKKGQEFVLDCADYPEAIPWLSQLFEAAV